MIYIQPKLLLQEVIDYHQSLDTTSQDKELIEVQGIWGRLNLNDETIFDNIYFHIILITKKMPSTVEMIKWSNLISAIMLILIGVT